MHLPEPHWCKFCLPFLYTRIKLAKEFLQSSLSNSRLHLLFHPFIQLFITYSVLCFSVCPHPAKVNIERKREDYVIYSVFEALENANTVNRQQPSRLSYNNIDMKKLLLSSYGVLKIFQISNTRTITSLLAFFIL